MADNVTIDNGALTDFDAATDDVGGKHYQRVKLDVGGDGASTPVVGSVPVGGDVAHDAADSGNPVKIGGVYRNSVTPVAADDRVEAQFGPTGIQYVSNTVPHSSDADGVGNTSASRSFNGYDESVGQLEVRSFVYNGATWDRTRGDAANGLDVDVTRLPALPAGTANIGDVDVLTVPAPLSTAGNGTAATAHRVTIASDSTGVVGLAAGSNNIGDVDVASIAAGDNNIGNVDIVTMPALPAGTNNIGDVDVLTLPGVGGLAAHASATSGNPVYIAGRASAAIPTDVGADGDAAGMWTNRNGATVVLMAPHVGLNSDPWALVHEGAQYTSAQTSTVLVAGGASEKIVVTKLQIQAFGTTAFDLQVYFGTGAFARGTNRACFDGTFKPSSTLAPGAILDGPFISGANGDDLLVTTSAAGSVTISVWYYVVV
jgi:hypothetical protein